VGSQRRPPPVGAGERYLQGASARKGGGRPARDAVATGEQGVSGLRTCADSVGFSEEKRKERGGAGRGEGKENGVPDTRRRPRLVRAWKGGAVRWETGVGRRGGGGRGGEKMEGGWQCVQTRWVLPSQTHDREYKLSLRINPRSRI
jgi:hypothetical protein